MRPFSIIAFCTFISVAACSKKDTAVHDPSASASATAAVTAPGATTPETAGTADAGGILPGEGAAPLEGMSSWTDPAVVRRLEIACTFDPSKLSEPQMRELFGDATGNATNYSCQGNAFDQSCVYDPCFEADDSTACKSRCLGACDTCEDGCTTSCLSCKAQCKDDACKKACAPACGKCKQDCLTAQDRCRTGTCGQIYTACRKKQAAAWKAGGCEARCKEFSPCRDLCYSNSGSAGDMTSCLDSCKRKVKPGCDLNLCEQKGGE